MFAANAEETNIQLENTCTDDNGAFPHILKSTTFPKDGDVSTAINSGKPQLKDHVYAGTACIQPAHVLTAVVGLQ